MKTVYRISVAGTAIHIENWANWTDFDARRPVPFGGSSDLARPFGGVPHLDAAGVKFLELQRIRVNNGFSAEARALVEEDLTLWQTAGAQVIGGFEVVHGHDLPALLVILGWSSNEDAFRAQSSLEADAGSIERHRTRRLALNRNPIRGTSRLLGCSLSLSAPS